MIIVWPGAHDVPVTGPATLDLAMTPNGTSPPVGRLAGRVALVTGAGAGLGLATATRFAAEGAQVICVDLDPATADAAARAIAHDGGRAIAAAADVTSSDDMESVVADAADRLGPVDVLFANAGVAGAGTAVTTSPVDWDRVIRVNLTGVWISARAVLPSMVERGRGSIVATASLAALAGIPNIAAYAASKGGVVALVRQMAADFSQYGIRVNAVCPGTIPTALVMESYASGGGVGGGTDVESRLRAAADNYPLGRLGRPEDVASAALFLASDDSDWITGIALPVDGGFSAR